MESAARVIAEPFEYKICAQKAQQLLRTHRERNTDMSTLTMPTMSTSPPMHDGTEGSKIHLGVEHSDGLKDNTGTECVTKPIGRLFMSDGQDNSGRDDGYGVAFTSDGISGLVMTGDGMMLGDSESGGNVMSCGGSECSTKPIDDLVMAGGGEI